MEYMINALIEAKNETVSSVASKLQLSRPTFDTYIAMYEDGELLPKMRYQKIFDSLFSDYYISQEAFHERLDMCENVLLYGGNVDSVAFLSKRADRASRLMNQIRQNINYEKFDEELYEFLDLVISHYPDDIFYHLIQFFLMLYGKKDTRQATDFQVAYFSNLFRAFDQLDQNAIHFDYSDWLRYQKKCENARVCEKLGTIKLEQERLKLEEQKLRRKLYDNKSWGMEF